MIDLCNSKTRKEEINEFFKWLLNKDDVELQSEVDLSLVTDYYDANIYYPTEIARFFNTKAMKRLERVSQLGLVLLENENCYHNRLEHSKGTYNRKVEELIFRYKDESFRKYIEDNDMKVYLLAELIKEAGHDIGHLPLSHIIELKIMNHKGFHEIIGKRILNEDPEIQEVLKSIDSRLPEVLEESLNNDILNFKAHDESSYDIDRLDYLNRDALYYGYRQTYLPHEEYKSVFVELNSDGSIKKSPDGSLILANSNCAHKKRIDVYDSKSLSEIEKALQSRSEAYSNVYYSSNTQLEDSTVGLFLQELLNRSPNQAVELQDFISKLKSTPADQIDLAEYITWDDFRFYKNCIDVAQNNEDSNFRSFATMVIPPAKSLMNFTYSSFNLRNKEQIRYSEEELQILKLIKSIVDGDDELSTNLKTPKYFFKNCRFTSDKTKIEKLKSKLGERVNCSEATIRSYNVNEPIFIKDEHGNIFSLDEHPNRSVNWGDEKKVVSIAFILLPQLQRTTKEILDGTDYYDFDGNR